MGYQGKYRRETSRRPVLKAVALSTVLVLVALVGTVFLTYQHLQGNITKSDAFAQITGPRPEEGKVVVGATKPLNVLILGSDTRTGQTDVLGRTPGLSDTTILLHLSADRKRAYGISIPRDLMVQRPICKSRDGKTMVPGASIAQWNEAYALGGESCTIAQFEKMSDLRVDHFVVVDFNGFKAMVDALGGVPVCVPQEVNDPIGRIHLRAGSYEVSGEQALDYVRVRHYIGTTDTGDIGRMKRQQAFLASMVNKAVSAGTLFNPVRLVRFLDAGTKSLTTDPDLSHLSALVDLAQQVRGIGLDKVQFFTVPFTAYAPDPNRLAPAPSAAKLWREIRDDEPLSREFTQDAAKASQGEPGTHEGPGKPHKPSPTESAEAAANGLCA